MVQCFVHADILDCLNQIDVISENIYELTTFSTNWKNTRHINENKYMSKKQNIRYYIITWATVNPFSKFFHWQIFQEIVFIHFIIIFNLLYRATLQNLNIQNYQRTFAHAVEINLSENVFKFHKIV